MFLTQEPMHLSIMGDFWDTISLYIGLVLYRPTLFIFITSKIYVFVSLLYFDCLQFLSVSGLFNSFLGYVQTALPWL